MANTTPVIGLILHFRTPEKTLNCLRSLQSENVSHAVIVDNSEDNGQSVSAMQDSLSALNQVGFTVEILNPGRNLGFAAGVNLGLNHVATQPLSCHVLLINSDARLKTGALAHMLQALTPSTIVAPLIAQGAQKPTSPFAYYDRLLGLNTSSPKVMPLRYASGCCLLLHAEQVHSPLLDQDFFFYGEDVMLSAAAGQHHLSEHECLQAVVSHATSSSAKNGSMFYEYHLNRAHWLLARKLARNPMERFVFVAARCVTLPLRALVRSLRSRSLLAGKGFLAATFDALRGRCRSFTPPAAGAQDLIPPSG